MSQYDFGNLEAPLAGTTFINTHIEPWRNALHSNHSASARPSYATAGMMWINTTTTPWVVNFFDGTDDIPLGTVNASTNKFIPSLTGDNVITGTMKRNAAELINNIFDGVAPSLNMNNIQDAGYYYINGTGWSNSPLTTNTHTGGLAVYRRASSFNGSVLTQIAQEFTEFTTGRIWTRAYNGSSWTSWEALCREIPGTFTPTLFGTTTPGTPTYVAQSGRYVKNGSLAWCTGRIQISALGGMAGNVKIGGLPFTPLNFSANRCSVTFSNKGNLNMATGEQLGGMWFNNETDITLLACSNTGDASLGVAKITANTTIYFTAVAEVDQWV